MRHFCKYTTFLMLAFAVNLFGSVAVDSTNFSGLRSTNSNEGMFATSIWANSGNGFQLSWSITQNQGLYHYIYSVSGVGGNNLSKEAKSILLQVSPTITNKNVKTVIQNPNIKISGNPKVYSSGKDTPGLPEDIYAIKFNIPNKSDEKFTLDFHTERTPVWGDFYANSNKHDKMDVYAYNEGFGKAPNEGTTDFTAWIPTPGSDSAAMPEPQTWLMMSTLVAFVVLVRKRRSVVV